MQNYQKHLVTCRCILPQFKSVNKPPQHKFIVFSIFNDDVIVPKLAQCNNCGILHKVVDICKSEIINGKEESLSLITIDDIKNGLPVNIKSVLESYDVSLPAWEQAQFIFENQRWGDIVPLTNELIDGMRQGKYLRILGSNLHKIDSYSIEEFLTK